MKTVTFTVIAVVLAVSSAWAVPFSNRGFETGSFPPWTLGGDELAEIVEGAPEGRFMAELAQGFAPETGEGVTSDGIEQSFDPLLNPVTMVVDLITNEEIGHPSFFTELLVFGDGVPDLTLSTQTSAFFPLGDGENFHTGFIPVVLPAGTTGVGFSLRSGQVGREGDFRHSFALIDLAPVPMPATLVLLGIGIAWLGWRTSRHPSHVLRAFACVRASHRFRRHA